MDLIHREVNHLRTVTACVLILGGRHPQIHSQISARWPGIQWLWQIIKGIVDIPALCRGGAGRGVILYCLFAQKLLVWSIAISPMK